MPMKETTSATSVFDIQKSENLPATAASEFFDKHRDLISNRSYTEIAKLAKISVSQLSRIVSGKTVPSTKMLDALSDALELSPLAKNELISCGNGTLFWGYIEKEVAYLKSKAKENDEEPVRMEKFYVRAGISKQKFSHAKQKKSNCSLKTALGLCVALNDGVEKERVEKAEQLLKLAGYRIFPDKENKFSFIMKQLEAGVSNVTLLETNFFHSKKAA